MILLTLLVGIVIAQNETNNSNQNNTNSTTEQCDRDSDCLNNYECKKGFCVLDNNETNETNDDDNETEDGCEWNCTKWTECTNQIQTRTCTNINNCTTEKPKETKNCDTKVCCMIIKTEDDNKTEIEYDLKESKDCLKNKTDEKREIVNNSLCKVKEKHEFKEKNRLKFEERTGVVCPEECTCTGVVMKCQLASGREMTIFAGHSGNIIVQIKGVNMTTNVTLYKENETIYGNFSNKTKEIKILPDQVRERIREKLKSEIEEESDIELEDDGNYKMEVKKKAKLFWVFSVKEKVKAEVDSENGYTKTNSPWWGFLARDSKG